MSWELQLRQRQREAMEISKIKKDITETIEKKRKLQAETKSLGQKIPKLYKKLFAKIDVYNQGW